MNHESLPKEYLKELLDEFLQTHYNASFTRMVCEYIRTRGVTEAEVDALLEDMSD
jgi:molybdopterin-biosynthesis enzyme MoeA-like protein